MQTNLIKSHKMHSYKKDCRRLEKAGLDLTKLNYLEKIICSGETPDVVHKPHALKRKGMWCECHVTCPTDDWVVLFRLEIREGEPKVVFRATGSHNHVFQSKHFREPNQKK